MKNTARTTVREGRQSSDNTYVRIAAAEQNCLQALSEHRQWWRGGHIRRQTVPDVGTGDRRGPGSDCRQAVWRHNELVIPIPAIPIKLTDIPIPVGFPWEFPIQLKTLAIHTFFTIWSCLIMIEENAKQVQRETIIVVFQL